LTVTLLLHFFYRRGHPAFEFVFAATEEAIFIHVIVSSKYDGARFFRWPIVYLAMKYLPIVFPSFFIRNIRMLSTGDLEKLLKLSTETTYRLPGWHDLCS
jgi:mediator of RNA polymerase II transcription subunit 13